ncbi:acyclic terpene utilization AtuA family protein [uncultured Nocardioides sp.]|uniref:acyclic terpene utilization AtuA family protein n=1 Tax=uncultured Nocardioides sp. TaxID=198441 RepID=UPI002621E9DF|nr:acyclic terpene utilization AtuA family protein [uncultured Nocardioides sp.]
MSAPDPGALVVGNCSGFYGDRLSAMREMLTGDPRPDVLTGDYLAELTMLILGRDQLRDAGLGYARTFLRQAEDCLGLLVEGGTRLVVNAGGLNPAGLAEKVREAARGLGLDVPVAHVEGDDVRSLGVSGHPWPEGALTANAYLGAAPITAALAGGAQVVVTGRCADASLVVGPAAWHHGWAYDDPAALDALAGATVAGHVLECGTHATGGNFSGFLDLPRDATPLGFPLAEVAADGSCVVTKQAGTGGAVTVDTVTAQLVYEVQTERYLTPDVTVRLDTVALEADGPDRVRVSGTVGEAPPETLKVSVSVLGGMRNHVDLVLTGLDLDAKEAWVRAQLEPRLSAASVTWTRSAAPDPDADTQQGASRTLRCTVRDADKGPVDRAFTAAVVDLALGSYPGFAPVAPPAPATPYGVHRAAYVARGEVEAVVVHDDGAREVVVDGGARPTGSRGSGPGGPRTSTSDEPGGRGATSPGEEPRDPVSVTKAPLGTFVHARSGDKGGDANLGLWVRHDDHPAYDDRVAWLLDVATPAWVTALLPEAEGLAVEVHPLPNLGGVNVLLPGLLGDGVAASARFDPQAKGLGEWARGRSVDLPEGLL